MQNRNNWTLATLPTEVFDLILKPLSINDIYNLNSFSSLQIKIKGTHFQIIKDIVYQQVQNGSIYDSQENIRVSSEYAYFDYLNLLFEIGDINKSTFRYKGDRYEVGSSGDSNDDVVDIVDTCFALDIYFQHRNLEWFSGQSHFLKSSNSLYLYFDVDVCLITI
jgi:hypothetical protein